MKSFRTKLSSMFLLALFATAFAQPQITVSPQTIVVNPVPTFSVETFVDKDSSGGSSPSYQVGEAISIGVRVSEAAYVYVFNVRSTGEIVQILPNRYDADGQNNYLQAGETKYFPPRGARYAFNVDGPNGLDKVIAVASRSQLDTRQLADFTGTGNFATSNIGQDGFAQTFSIVVTPIAQGDWVTDTALFNVGRAQSVVPTPAPPPPPPAAVVLFNNPYLTAYPGSNVTYFDGRKADFNISVSLSDVYTNLHNQMIQGGWQRVGLEIKNNFAQASYQLNNQYVELELKSMGSSGRYRLMIVSL
ncbi:MAG: DUF4384 domain-containing protein [Trueperaceae bacterium]